MNESSKVVNLRTGREVINDELHAEWREKYYRKIEEQRGEQWMQMTNAIHAANLSGVHILGTHEIAEYFGCNQGTAYNWMKEGIIPSFQIGKRWFTHDYVIDQIETKARDLLDTGFIKRSYPRLVWKSDQGKKW